MKIATRLTLEYPQDPDVRFVVRALTERARAVLYVDTGDLIERMRKFEEDFASAETMISKSLALRRRDRLWTEYREHWIRAALEEIHGVEIDGQKASVETFIEYAPDDLLSWLVNEIDGTSRLLSDESKNSEPPSTSTAAADGGSPSSTASSANGSATTTSATAESTSPTS